jgi:hypothetical protein
VCVCVCVCVCVALALAGGTGSELPALRCSAISALATLCAKLRYALQPYLVDIVPTACHMLAMDKETVRHLIPSDPVSFDLID